MYASFRDYYRSMYGVPNRRSRNRGLRSRWRWLYNRTRPTYDYDYYTADDLLSDSEPEATRETELPTGGGTGNAGNEAPNHPTNEDAPVEPEPPKPEPPKPEPPKDVSPFHVKEVDFKLNSNKFLHHTKQYKHEGLIVRRGQEFQLDVKVDKAFVKGEDVIKLQLSLGKTPQQSKGTMFMVTPGDSIDLEDASAVIDSIDTDEDGSTIHLKANMPVDSVVGRFSMQLRLQNKEDAGDVRKFVKHKVAEPFIVLFNPWCKDDSVYVEDDDQRKEYVLSDSGQIYTGSSTRPRYRNWAFGQFEQTCLDAAIYLLDNSMLPYEAYGNPVRVTRTLSAMVNSNDGDKGVLTGNWTGDYEGGTSPTKWVGSIKILKQYMDTKAAVNFGQCWVFSGVVTTVSRALGIPTRSVTNFDSAHDTDLSMTIDYHLDKKGEPIKHLNDSVWNFHVWNEAWFKRPDLPDGNDGWQAFDATPQEQSDGVMQCGPAPLAAIKAGNVHLSYDAKFIFAEVNGDRITWKVDENNDMTVKHVDTDNVGAKISTKAVGSKSREDVTHLYKHTEGTSKERAVAKKVAQLSSRKQALEEYYKLDVKNDVNMTFSGEVLGNGDANFKFTAENKSDESRTVSGNFYVMARYYTGIEGDDIDKKNEQFKVEPNKEETFSWELKGADWLNKIDEDATIGVYVHAEVKETSQIYVSRDSYSIDKPELEVTVSKSTVKVGEEIDVTIKFRNPLDIPLTKASLMVEGAGISDTEEIVIAGQIPPHDESTTKLTLTPQMAGNREIIASFHSRQLVNIDGSVEIEVTE